MYYTVYKITNKINNKIYIGVHKTFNLDDEYMGSGKHLKRAQEKYGMENFEKEILEVFDNPEDMFQMESILANEEFVQSSDTYNLKIGGEGGFDYINENCGNQGIRLNLNMDNEKRVIGGQRGGKLAMTNLHERRKTDTDLDKAFRLRCSNAFKDNTHSDETKALIGAKNSISQLGAKNSQFGTIWIHNLDLKESKKIKKDEFPEYENLGWLKGRKIKW